MYMILQIEDMATGQSCKLEVSDNALLKEILHVAILNLTLQNNRLALREKLEWRRDEGGFKNHHPIINRFKHSNTETLPKMLRLSRLREV
jgi:hypothetical protein